MTTTILGATSGVPFSARALSAKRDDNLAAKSRERAQEPMDRVSRGKFAPLRFSRCTQLL